VKPALRRAVLAHQGPLEGLEALGRRLVGSGVGQRAERLEQHLAVARAAESPAGVAEGDVLAPVGLVAEFVAGEPHRRAQALEALARLVDGRAQILVGLALQALDRPVELTASDAPHAVRHALAVTQPKPTFVLPRMCFHARSKRLRCAPRANAEFDVASRTDLQPPTVTRTLPTAPASTASWAAGVCSSAKR
jgi:hypothetical protein